MMEELKACECGKYGAIPWFDTVVTSSPKWRIRCSTCPASTTWYDTQDKAIAAWNRRAHPSREEIARAIYGTFAASSDDPWDAAVERRSSKGLSPYAPEMAKANDAADAVLRLIRGEEVASDA